MIRASIRAENLEFYGPEPEPDDTEMSSSDRAKALTWYGYNTDASMVREFYQDLLKAMDRQDDLKTLKRVPDVWLNRTGSYLSRLVMRGATLPESSLRFLEDRLTETLSHAEEEEQTKAKGTTNIQERIREKTSIFIGNLEGMIDDGLTEDWNMYDHLRLTNATPLIAREVVKRYTPVRDELVEAHETTDPQLLEGYGSYGNEGIAKLALFYNAIIEDAARYAETGKKMRMPRKKKALSVEKLLRGFKYSKSYADMRIASIDPTKIIGAQELWTFNWKNNLLTVFRALDRGGLSIRGSKIVNFDETSSVAKKIGRKTQERVDGVLSGGKVALRNLMNDISGTGGKPSRLNDSTILLRTL